GSTPEELYERLRKVLEIARANGITSNLSKCQFFTCEVEYLGHIFNEEDVRLNKNCIRAFTDMESPADKKSLQRFLGMTNYVSKFIPNYSKLSAPLKELLKNDMVFEWQNPHQIAFDQLKSSLVNSGILSYFDPKSYVVLSVDSSSQGLGAVILQNNKPIIYSSRALTKSEQAYCSIGREMLGIVNGCIKLRQFLIGRGVEVHTDHRPLETLFKRLLNKVPSRLQRMMFAVQGFDLHLVYKSGKELFIADALSRTFVNEPVEKEFYNLNKEVICQVNEICKDTELIELKKYITAGWPDNKGKLNQIGLIKKNCT
ncbi:hypothetical protein ILUMI_18449, partial [Ignelater luminosus]